MTQPSKPPAPALTWREREQLTAEWHAIEELQRATDSMREHSRYGRNTDVDTRRLHAAEQAWDAVREGRSATRVELTQLVAAYAKDGAR